MEQSASKPTHGPLQLYIFVNQAFFNVNAVISVGLFVLMLVDVVLFGR